MTKIIFMDKLPCKVQPGDPVTFRLNEAQSFSAHVQAVKFTNDGEVLYDLDVYPVEDKWTEFHLRLSEIPSAFVEEIPEGTIGSIGKK